MKRPLRSALLGGAMLLLVLYGGAVGFLALRENAMVFVGAGSRGSTRLVPSDAGGIPWDSLRVQAADGAAVFLIESRLDSADSKPWALFFHGNAGLVGSRSSVARYALLREAGFNVLAVEFRGYGASATAGSPSEDGVYADAQAAWTYLTKTRGIPPKRVALYGWSLGSGLATHLAKEVQPGALITEGAFTSLPDMGSAMYPWVPVELIMRNRFDNIERAGSLSLPWLVFHGRNDDEVPFSHGQALAAAAHTAQLIPLRAGHDDGVTADGEVTLNALRALARQLTDSSSATSSADSTRIVMLGTGTPNADPERSGPAVAVVRGERSYLVDAGAGIVRRAAAAARGGIAALRAPNLRTVFLTHLHSDHTVGLPDLILSPWTLERTSPLEVYGPPGTKAMIDHLLAAYAADIRNRIDGLEPANTTGHRVDVQEISDGFVFRDGDVVVRAFAVPHGDWEHSFGYRVETPDRNIVISGDTRASDAAVRACNGCDVLVHEVYSADRFKARDPEWRRYHASAHTSTSELAALATRARPRLLVLYHQLYWGTDDAGLVAELRGAGYTGAVQSGRDLAVYR